MIKRFIFFIFIFLMALNLHAETNFTSTEYCQGCHGDKHLQPVTDTGTQLNLFVDLYQLNDGSHQSLECVECHQPLSNSGIESYQKTPHNIKLTLSCDSCHQDYFYEQKEQFQQSIHYKRMKEQFSCDSCHNPHTEGAATWSANKQQVCMDCHTKKVIYESLSPTNQHIGNQDLAHTNALPFATKHLQKLQCLDCHADPNSPHNIKEKGKAVLCNDCHSKQSLLIKQVVDNNAGRFLDKELFDDTRIKKILSSTNQPQALLPLSSDKEKLSANYLLGKNRNEKIDNTLWLIAIILIIACALHGLIRYQKSSHNNRLGVEKKTYLYSLPVRVWHWINATCFIVLMFTGLLSHYGASPLNIYVSIHNTFSFILIFSWIFFIILCLTGNGHHYIPNFATLFSDITIQIKYYLSGIFKCEPHPFHANKERKFNPLQQLGYISIMFGLVPALIITGILIYWPNLLPTQWQAKELIATLHTVFALFCVLFLIFHLYLITTGRTVTALIKGMKDGYHRE
ncbi:TPA: thiosulfate reductase cytochrome B subunit [Photobacterium damselae]